MKHEQYRFSVSLRSMREAQTLANGGSPDEAVPGAAVFDASELAEAQFIAGRAVRHDDPHAIRHLREKRVAESLMTAVAEGDVWSAASLETQLPRAYVTALRMGPVRAVSDADVAMRDLESVEWDGFGLTYPASGLDGEDGYVRTRIGMSLADSPGEVWSSARGYWRMSADTEYLVPTRFGFAPYVFKIDEWAEFGTRMWAPGGQLVDLRSGKLLRMIEATGDDPAWFPTVADDGEPATADDLAVARLISGRIIGLGKRGPNPVQRLRSRTRRLNPRED